MTAATARRWRGAAAALALAGLAACQSPPPAPPSHAELVRGELERLVASQQPTCGAVRLYSRHDRLDYRVECESGLAYRIRVGADGRVTIKPDVGPAAAPAAPAP